MKSLLAAGLSETGGQLPGVRGADPRPGGDGSGEPSLPARRL